MTLVKDEQNDFSAGGHPLLASERVPSNGFADGINALVGDDGLPFRRGGSTVKSNADLASGGRFIWDGYLDVGRRTVFAGPAGIAVLGVDDATPILLDNPPITTPGKPAMVRGLLYLPGGWIYGGARRAATYTTGTASGTPGSKIITGVGTAWLANAEAGQLLNLGGFYSPIKSVDSDTQLTLTRDYLGAGGGPGVYAIQPIGLAPPKVADIYLAIANRLLACVDDVVYESAIGSPQTWPDNELWNLPEGSRVIGAEAVRDTALIFTTAGVFAISGLAYELTDFDGNLQQRLEQVNGDLILWSWAGVAEFGNALIVPAVDGVYLFDGISSPTRITGGFDGLYRSYVDAGYHTGMAQVIAGHYVLPILDSSQQTVDQLVCRLIPTLRGRGTTRFAWTRNDGYAQKMTGVAVRTQADTARDPILLGVHRDTGRVVELDYFGTTASDGDGTAHVMELVTREFNVGGMVRAFVKRLLARYVLTDPAAANPTLSLAYSVDGEAWVTVTGAAPEGDMSDDAYPWRINKKAHGIRFRIRTSGAISKFVLHALQLALRPSGRPVK